MESLASISARLRERFINMKIGNAFPSEYLKAADLSGKAVRVVIEDVTSEKVGEDQKPVMHFVGKDKSLILNKTNANRIVEATGTDETDQWAGWTITLYPCKVDFKGERVDAIRVDDRPGASKAPGARTKQAPPPPQPDEDPPDITDDDIPF
jgi:hypothetical protein